MNRTTNKELLDGQYDLLSSIISTPESSFRLIAKDTNAKDEEEHKDNGCSNRDNIDKKGEEQEVEEDSSAPEEFEPIPFGPAVFLSSGAAAASDDDHGVAGDAYAKEHLLHQQQMYKGEQERGQETKKQLKERDKYQEYGGKCTMLPHSFDSTNSSRSEFPPCHYPTGNNYHYSYHYHGAPMGRTYGWGMQETSRYRELGAGKSNDDDSSSRFCHDGLATSTTHSSHDRERWSNQYHYNYGQEDDKSRSSMSTRTSMSYSTCGGGKEKGKSHEYHGDTTRGFYRHHVQQNQGQLGSENASWHGKSLHHEQDDSRRVHGHEYNSYSLSYYDHRTNTNSNTSSTINHHFNDSRIGHGWHNGDTSFGNKAVTTTASSTDESMATHVASNQQCRHTQNSANYPHVTTTQSTTVQQLHSTNDNYVFQRCSLQQQQQQHNWYMSGEVNDSYQHSCYNNESLATSQYHGYDTNSTILEHHHRHQHQPHFGVSNIVQDPSHSLHSSTFADVFVDVDDEQKRNSSYASFGSNFYTNNTITSSSTTNDISPGDVQSMGAGDWPLQFHEQHDNHGNEQETDQKNWSSNEKTCNDDQSPHSSRAADEILATIPQKLRRISNDGSSSTPRTAGPLESKCQKSAHDDDGDVEDDTIHHTCASFIPETTGNHVHDDDHQQQQQQSQQEPLLIVISSDKKYATKYSYRVMKEVTLAHFDESDRRGKRQKIPLGFPGLACRHCHGVRTLPSAIHNDLILPTYQRTGRYFPSTLKSFSDTKKTLNAIFSHLIRCQKCPQEVKQNLIKLEKEHSSERASKNYGSQSRFFLRIWHRIHKKDKPRSISTSTSNTEE
jgi:hypothetical protein